MEISLRTVQTTLGQMERAQARQTSTILQAKKRRKRSSQRNHCQSQLDFSKRRQHHSVAVDELKRISSWSFNQTITLPQHRQSRRRQITRSIDWRMHVCHTINWWSCSAIWSWAMSIRSRWKRWMKITKSTLINGSRCSMKDSLFYSMDSDQNEIFCKHSTRRSWRSNMWLSSMDSFRVSRSRTFSIRFLKLSSWRRLEIHMKL